MDVTHFLDEEFRELYHYIGIDVPNAVATTATTNQGTPERSFSFFVVYILTLKDYRDGSISPEVVSERWARSNH